MWEPLSERRSEGGTAQGAVLSPLRSNLYLDPLNHQMAGEGIERVRYADDLVLLCRSREEVEQAFGCGDGRRNSD